MTFWTEDLLFSHGRAPVRCTGTGVPGLVAHSFGCCPDRWHVSHVASGLGLGPSFSTLYELWDAVDRARESGFCDWGRKMQVTPDGYPTGRHGRWLHAFRLAAGWKLKAVT